MNRNPYYNDRASTRSGNRSNKSVMTVNQKGKNTSLPVSTN